MSTAASFAGGGRRDMPIMSKHYRKTFKFFQVDGVPAAETVVLAGHAWILCCPLCGCLHEVRGGQTEGAYRPDCLLRRLAAMPAVRGVHAGADWARVLALWQSAYPAAAHDTVLLLSPAALEAAQVKRPAARPRKAA